jgi:hypothetical protein
MWLRMHLVAALLRSHRSGGTQAEVNRGVASGSSSPPAAAVGPPTAAAGPAAAVPPPDTPPPDTSQLAPYFSQSLTFLEAENMTGNGGWEARHWAQGGNYFASTVNNVFMSRRRFLHAPADATSHAVAHGTVTVGAAGPYLVMVRYEALYRFETPFRLTVRQVGYGGYGRN